MCIATDTLGNKFSAGYMSSRAGAIAVSQFPLIAALGTKNNILGCMCFRLSSRDFQLTRVFYRYSRSQLRQGSFYCFRLEVI